MTLARTDWQKDTKTPPRTNDDVARVMIEESVGRRAAYDIVRRRKAAEIDTNGIGQNQKVAIMAILISKPEAGRNTDTMIAAMHEAGIKISGHDVQKTLWALSKADHVSFRTRNLTNRRTMVYAIKPTESGLSAYAFAPPDAAIAAVTTDENGEVEATWSPPVIEEAVASVALDHDAEVQTMVEEAPAHDPINAPTVDDWVGKYPAIKAVLDRADKAAKINAAAKLLEEAGEEDIALTLMGKTEFNPLEQEVIALLHHIGGIE